MIFYWPFINFCLKKFYKKESSAKVPVLSLVGFQKMLINKPQGSLRYFDFKKTINFSNSLCSSIFWEIIKLNLT